MNVLYGGYLAPSFFYYPILNSFSFEYRKSHLFFSNKELQVKIENQIKEEKEKERKGKTVNSYNYFIGHSIGCLYAPFIEAETYILFCPVLKFSPFFYFFEKLIQQDIEKLKGWFFDEYNKQQLSGLENKDSNNEYNKKNKNLNLIKTKKSKRIYIIQAKYEIFLDNSSLSSFPFCKYLYNNNKSLLFHQDIIGMYRFTKEIILEN